MPNYLGLHVLRGHYSFTVNLLDRPQKLLSRQVNSRIWNSAFAAEIGELASADVPQRVNVIWTTATGEITQIVVGKQGCAQ